MTYNNDIASDDLYPSCIASELSNGCTFDVIVEKRQFFRLTMTHIYSSVIFFILVINVYRIGMTVVLLSTSNSSIVFFL